MTPKTWIALHWGENALEAWQMHGPRMEATRRRALPEIADAPQAISELLAPWHSPQQPLDVIACGLPPGLRAQDTMLAVPAKVLQLPLCQEPSPATGLRLWALPGLCQKEPADLMGAGAAQIAGFLSLAPEYDGVLCLIDDQSCWAHISAGEVVSFRSTMTPALLQLLSTHPRLQPAITGEGWDASSFAQAVEDGIAHPQRLSAQLSGLHAGAVLTGSEPAQTRARLAGLLIGAELAGAKPYWLGMPVAVIGPSSPADAYASALAQQGVAVSRAESETMLLAGLYQAWWTRLPA
ncbi:MAG: 2-dehydro-3-deoxygalactonokinase [Mangrovicoccus sp.]|nr:2-dehydro-3-deoxygalactonokinase [Mangrovicoccus sp.]